MRLWKSVWFLVVLAMLMLASFGCVYRMKIDESEAGIIMADGVSVSSVVGVGRHTNMAWLATGVQIDCSAKTLEWVDPSVVTKDKQEVGYTVGVTYRRKNDHDSVMLMWTTYRSEAQNDDALKAQVENRMGRVVKNISTQFSLDEQLGVGETRRASVEVIFEEQLGAELAEIGVELLDVGINDIAVSESFKARLAEKANAAAQAEIAKQRTLELKEKLIQETAQTEIGVEIARRERLVEEEKAKVFEVSDRAFELAKIEAMAGMYGKNDKLIFVPPGSDISLLMSGDGGWVPVD